MRLAGRRASLRVLGRVAAWHFAGLRSASIFDLNNILGQFDATLNTSMQPDAVMLAADPRNALGRAAIPPLKWAGGKRWIVPHLLTLWPKHSRRRLAEPFCGGLAVALGLGPKRALLNDINPHLVNFYRWLKKGLCIGLRMENEESLYYRHRDKFNRLLAEGRQETKEAAELFYYLNRTGYNGLCRFNRKGFYNVPFGSYASINYKRDFAEYKSVLKNWSVSSKDFEEICIRSDDLVYADPPYDVEFTAYSKQAFGWDEQRRLAEWLAGLKCPVILSNQATERIVELYQELNFKISYLDAPRMISCTGNRDRAREVLATKGV